MEKREYRTMYNVEDNYWWYAGLRELVCSSIDKFSQKKACLRILDAGCGTGGMMARCKAYKICGIDISEEAINFCKLRKLDGKVIRSTVSEMPFGDNSFDIVISLDVLYHLQVENDLKALGELHRILDKDGILLLNLPAMPYLESEHGKAIHTRHRYTCGELREKVQMSGFKIVKITYRNTILFPLTFVMRFARKVLAKKEGSPKSDLRPLPDLINRFLSRVLFFENRLIFLLNYPFGSSVFCVAKK